MKIAYITWGTAPQLVSYNDFNHILTECIYLPKIDKSNLKEFSAIVIPDFMNISLLKKHQNQINDYLYNGGFLIVFGANKVEEWIKLLPLKWHNFSTKDWKWWMREDGHLEIYYPEPYHPITKVIPLADMSWHWFGAFEFIPKSFPILNLDEDKGCIFFDYVFKNTGRIMITTLDPHHHHGRYFMPATSRFLKNFYPWLQQEVYDIKLGNKIVKEYDKS